MRKRQTVLLALIDNRYMSDYYFIDVDVGNKSDSLKTFSLSNLEIPLTRFHILRKNQIKNADLQRFLM